MSYSSRKEASSPKALANLLQHETDWRCPMEITEKGESAPCERHATAVVTYCFEGRWYLTPICTFHANRAGRGNSVPLADILAAREVLA